MYFRCYFFSQTCCLWARHSITAAQRTSSLWVASISPYRFITPPPLVFTNSPSTTSAQHQLQLRQPLILCVSPSLYPSLRASATWLSLMCCSCGQTASQRAQIKRCRPVLITGQSLGSKWKVAFMSSMTPLLQVLQKTKWTHVYKPLWCKWCSLSLSLSLSLCTLHPPGSHNIKRNFSLLFCISFNV